MADIQSLLDGVIETKIKNLETISTGSEEEKAATQNLAIESGDDTALKDAVNNMFFTMNEEVKNLIKTRHVRFDHSTAPIIKEMNDKWNAVARLAEKDYGASPIYRDSYKKYWLDLIPELRRYI